MKTSTCARITAVALCVAWAILASQDTVSAEGRDMLEKLRWGVLLQADRPYYSVGETMKATYAIFNYTDQDVFGRVAPIGGHGCEYAFTVVNSEGDAVWQPGSIVDGEYVPPICAFGVVPLELPSGSRDHRGHFIDLVYQNSGGIGTQGSPLPAGMYELRVAVMFQGPFRDLETRLDGTGFTASLPFQIEP